MKRREFLKTLAVGAAVGGAALALGSVAGGCVSLVNPNAWDKNAGQPWRCTNCGHVERSTKYLSDTHCPRCYHKAMVKITEEELQQHLANQKPPVKA